MTSNNTYHLFFKDDGHTITDSRDAIKTALEKFLRSEGLYSRVGITFDFNRARLNLSCDEPTRLRIQGAVIHGMIGIEPLAQP